MSSKKEIQKLEEFIKYHSKKYYNGNPEIDDTTFDASVKKLSQLDPENKLLTQVGKDESKEFEKRNHVMPMNSLGKAQNREEFEKWFNREQKRSSSTHFVVQHKLDGCSIELQYKNGKFKYAVTRGNGVLGDDITRNVSKMQGVTKTIPDFNGSIRGEIILTQTMYKKKYSHEDYSRNLSNGKAKKRDGSGCEDLQVVVYDVFTDNIETERQKLEFLKEHFPYIAETLVCKAKTCVDKVMEWYDNIYKILDKLDIDIDGLVVKCDQSDKEDAKREKPNRQLAIKFPDTGYHTTLIDVEWSISGNIYTPVGLLEPIMIDGSEVKRASLCNPGILRGLGLKIGSTVSVIKAKKIIPKIISIVELGEGAEIDIPTECTNCGEELICNDSKLFCPNKECTNLLLHQLKKWINTLNILEFGERLIELVFEHGMVEELADLYTLQVEELAELVSSGKKVGMKNAKKCMTNLLAKTEITLPVFIAGFDIPSVGEKLIDLLVEAEYDTLEKLQKAEVDELTLVKGVGDKKAISLKDGLILHKKAMKRMLQHVTIVKPTVNEKTDISVCFTGVLSRPRKELEALVKSAGGTVKKTVVNGLSYLVTDSPNSGSKKNQDAQKKGVQVIDEAEFIRLFR